MTSARLRQVFDRVVAHINAGWPDDNVPGVAPEEIGHVLNLTVGDVCAILAGLPPLEEGERL
jgi:hypothetical protein